jgi:hypothetical protein
MECRELCFITNVINDRIRSADDKYTLEWTQIYNQYRDTDHGWCPECQNMMRRMFRYSPQSISVFMSHEPEYTCGYNITRAELVYHLKHGYGAQWINDMINRGELIYDREIALLEIQSNAKFETRMLTFLSIDEIISIMIMNFTSYYRFIEMRSQYNIDLFTTNVFDLIIEQFRRTDISRDVLASRNRNWAEIYKYMPHDVQDARVDELMTLFPYVVLNGYYKIREYFAQNKSLSPEICPLSLFENTLAYSDNYGYVASVTICIIHKYINGSIYTQYIHDLVDIIITKYPNYISQLVFYIKQDNGDESKAYIRHSDQIPADIILNNPKKCASILYMLRHDDRRNRIKVHHIDEYIKKIYRDEIAEGRDVDVPINIFDIVQINSGACIGDISGEILFTEICDILDGSNIHLNPIMIISPDIRECAINYLMDMLRKHPQLLHFVSGDSLADILARMSNEFWQRMCVIRRMMRRQNIPRELEEMIMLFFINPAANDADFELIQSVQKITRP